MDDRHRPWPRPDRAWAIAQEWHHVLFLHWPVDCSVLRPLVPPPLEIEACQGSSWVTALPFLMRRLRPRGLPAILCLSSFLQFNLRTYVTLGGRPGVFLMRVAVGNPIAVAIARHLLHLPYERARLELRKEGEDWSFTCRPRRGGAGSRVARTPLSFAARYRPEGAASPPATGSLESWLTERFCFYTAAGDGTIRRGELDHPPWHLQPARAEILESARPAASGVEGGGRPALVRYCRRQTAWSWWPERVDGSA